MTISMDIYVERQLFLNMTRKLDIYISRCEIKNKGDAKINPPWLRPDSLSWEFLSYDTMMTTKHILLAISRNSYIESYFFHTWSEKGNWQNIYKNFFLSNCYLNLISLYDKSMLILIATWVSSMHTKKKSIPKKHEDIRLLLQSEPFGKKSRNLCMIVHPSMEEDA